MLHESDSIVFHTDYLVDTEIIWQNSVDGLIWKELASIRPGESLRLIPEKERFYRAVTYIKETCVEVSEMIYLQKARSTTLVLDIPKDLQNRDDLFLGSLYEDLSISDSRKYEFLTPDTDSVAEDDDYFFLVDGDENIYQIAYRHPGADSVMMNAQSTALALILMGPWSSSLSVEARRNLYADLSGIPEFVELVNEIESLSSEGKPLFVEENQLLHEKLNAVLQRPRGFKNVAKMHSSAEDDILPVTIAKLGNSVLIESAGNLNSYAIGIYPRNGQTVQGKSELVIPVTRKKLVNNSILEALYQWFEVQSDLGPYSEPFSTTIDLNEIGEYTIAVRSAAEFDEPLGREALKTEIRQTLYEIIPMDEIKDMVAPDFALKEVIGMTSTCYDDLISSLVNSVSGQLKDKYTSTDYVRIIYETCIKELPGLVDEYLDCLREGDPLRIGINKGQARRIKKTLSKFNKYLLWLTIGENVVNYGGLGHAIISNPSSVDYCYYLGNKSLLSDCSNVSIEAVSVQEFSQIENGYVFPWPKVKAKDHLNQEREFLTVGWRLESNSGILENGEANLSFQTDEEGESFILWRPDTSVLEEQILYAGITSGSEGEKGDSVGFIFQVKSLTVNILAGNGQYAPYHSDLTEPFQVLVTDQDSIPQNQVPVRWWVETGDGILSDTLTFTDINGIASVNFTCGESAENSIGMVVKDSNGQLSKNSPLFFTVSSYPGDYIINNWGDYRILSSEATHCLPAFYDSITTRKLGIRISDSNNYGIKDIPVKFRFISNELSLSDTMTTTMGNGVAYVEISTNGYMGVVNGSIILPMDTIPVSITQLDCYSQYLEGTRWEIKNYRDEGFNDLIRHSIVEFQHNDATNSLVALPISYYDFTKSEWIYEGDERWLPSYNAIVGVVGCNPIDCFRAIVSPWGGFQAVFTSSDYAIGLFSPLEWIRIQ